MSLDLSKLEKVRERGGKTIARCPVCAKRGEDSKGEHLSIREDGAYSCIRDCDTKEIFALAGEAKSSRNGHTPSHATKANPSKARRIEKIPDYVIEGGIKASFVCSYQYDDEQGKPLYSVARYAFPPGSEKAKTFRQYPIVEGGFLTGEGCMKAVRLVPYRLPLIAGAETVIVAEGERDVESLEALGYVATSNAGGAEKWREEWSHYFAGKHVVVFPDNDDPGRRHADQVEAALRPVAKSFKRIMVPAPAKDITNHLDGLNDTEARAAVEELLSVPDPMDALLDARRFDLANPPAKPVPVLSINGKTIATAGNLVAVTSQAKAGKTALETAMMAALMEPTGDCLGITGQNPDGLPVLHFDTEQSRYDHHAVVLLTLRRAGREQPPEWLWSYSVADVATKDRRKALAHEMKRAAIAGNLRAVCVDGIADLCVDPNDPAEAFGLIEELHRLAIDYDCPIVCVLHENPGGADTGKTRGHLGSQLERKAETNLRLSKDAEGITTVFSERSRHCHIPKDTGPRFAWDESAGMHLSCASIKGEKENAKAHEIDGVLAQVFEAAPLLSYTDLRGAIMRIRGITQRAAEKYIASLQPKFIKQTASGLYGVKS